MQVLTAQDINVMSHIVYGMTAKHYMRVPDEQQINPQDLQLYSEATLRMCISKLADGNIENAQCSDHQRQVFNVVREHFSKAS